MNLIKICKVVSTACTVLGLGASLVGGAADKKLEENMIDTKIEEKLAKALKATKKES